MGRPAPWWALVAVQLKKGWNGDLFWTQGTASDRHWLSAFKGDMINFQKKR